MAMREPASLSYAQLNKKVAHKSTAQRTMSLLICAEFSAHVLIPLLENLFAEQGVAVTVQVTPFGEPELLPSLSLPSSPDYLCLLPSIQPLELRQRKSNIDHEASRWTRAAELFCQQHPTSRILLADLALAGHPIDSIAQTINQQWYQWSEENPLSQIIHLQQLSQMKGVEQWFDPRLWYTAKLPCTLEQLGAYAFEIVKTVLSRVFPLKVVVVDFDNTLWGGEIGDLNPEQIILGESPEGEAYVDFQYYLKELVAQGVILVGCTRNPRHVAELPFQHNRHMVLTLADFAHIEAGPENKASALEKIKKLVNVALDSMLFIDDSSFERALVQNLLPAISTPHLPSDPALRVPFLRQLIRLDGPLSNTGRERNELVRQNIARDTERQNYPTEAEFLRSLQMKAVIRPASPDQLTRVMELLERTNQYNMTGLRLLPKDAQVLGLSLEDRFGHHGLVAIALTQTRDRTLEIENFVMSCRVASRGVEDAFFHHLKMLATQNGLLQLSLHFKPTEKNVHCREVLLRNHFVEENASWTCDLTSPSVTHWVSYE